MSEVEHTGRGQRIAERFRRFAGTETGRRSIRAARILFLLAVLALLIWQLRDIGWSDLWSNLPTQPLFYVLFLVLYFFQIAGEMVIFRMAWTFRWRDALPAFIRKRVYNRDVLGYSGEVYIAVWAQANVDASRRSIAETVRDNNILSSLASTLVAVVLLSVFLSVGRISLRSLVGDHVFLYLGLSVAVLAGLVLLWTRFRHLIFSMPRNKAVTVFFMQVARFLIGRTLQILQWMVVLPTLPLGVWLTYSAASILLSRIPFLPNQTLVFAGLGIEMTGMMDVPVAPIAGMLVVTGILEKVLNLALFAAVSVRQPQPRTAVPS